MPHNYKHLTALALAAILVATAYAQSTPPPTSTEKIPVESTADTVKTADSEPTVLDTVQVTGSRVPQLAGQATITPVTSIAADAFVRYGISNLSDLTRAIPQLGPNTAGNAWTSLIGTGPSPGLSSRSSFSIGGLNLANSSVGGVTLILVDGRRLSKSGQSFGGGGNLEDYDLNGIPIDAIERIDIITGGASAIYGADAMAGVVNVILKKNAGYNTSAITVRYDNSFDTDTAVKTATFSTNLRKGKFTFSAAGSVQESDSLASSDRWYTATVNLKTFGGKYDNRSSYVGAIWTDSGTTYAIPSGSKGSSTADAFSKAGTPAMYDDAVDSIQIDPTRGRSALLKFGYDFVPWFKLYSDVRWNEKTSTSTQVPTIGYYYPEYDYGYGLTIPAGVAGNPLAESVTLNKVFPDLKQKSTSTSRNPEFTLGFDGDFHAWHDWHYDNYFSWAESQQNYSTPGNFDLDKLDAAIAKGTAPILIYDSAAGNPNAAGVLESFLAADWNREKSDTSTYNATFSGPVATLPAGDIQVVVGGEWLNNRATFSANPDSSYSSYLLAGTISRSDVAAFAETQIPLLSAKQNIPLIDKLTVNASARHDHYSDVGGATTKNFGALFSPVSWLTFRGSRAEGFKPVALWSLYQPYYNFGGYTFPGSWYQLYDPVLREAVGTIGTYNVGHSDLKPTTSVSKNLGVVVDIPFVKGLSFGVEFTKTEIVNSLGSPEYQAIIDHYPDRVVRDPITKKITALDTSAVNTTSYETQSITYSASYQKPTNWGDFFFEGAYTIPTVTRSRATATSSLEEAWLPKRASASLGWQHGPLGASVSTVYQGSFNLYPSSLARGFDATYHSYIEWNPSVSYDFGLNRRFNGKSSDVWAHVLGHLRATFTVDNVFDSEPSRATAGSGRLAQDVRGSRYIIEVKKQF